MRIPIHHPVDDGPQTTVSRGHQREARSLRPHPNAISPCKQGLVDPVLKEAQRSAAASQTRRTDPVGALTLLVGLLLVGWVGGWSAVFAHPNKPSPVPPPVHAAPAQTPRGDGVADPIPLHSNTRARINLIDSNAPTSKQRKRTSPPRRRPKASLKSQQRTKPNRNAQPKRSAQPKRTHNTQPKSVEPSSTQPNKPQDRQPTRKPAASPIPQHTARSDRTGEHARASHQARPVVRRTVQDRFVSTRHTSKAPGPNAKRQGVCPYDMVLIDDPNADIRVCMDRFEAPNRPGSLPLVMYTWYQAEAWCDARGKRLCYDDEWIRACQGPRGWNYPYGPNHRAGACNDDKIWLQYDRILQRRWPTPVSQPHVEDLDELLTAAAASSPTGAESAEHIQWLYQADPSGSRVECGSHEGVFDLIGNVEEWVRRREDSGRPEFTNRLMGRFWAEQFHCGMTVSSHGNGFRFYEIGFRCCQAP